MRVCRVTRATSYLPCFIASMARSNSTLSGCLESTFAIGLVTFLLMQPVAASRAAPMEIAMSARRNIPTTFSKPQNQSGSQPWEEDLLTTSDPYQGRILRGFQQIPCVARRVAMPEYGTSGDDNLDPGANRLA